MVHDTSKILEQLTRLEAREGSVNLSCHEVLGSRFSLTLGVVLERAPFRCPYPFGVKRPRPEANHLSPSSDEVINAGKFMFIQ
jgi:hypothetical protein